MSIDATAIEFYAFIAVAAWLVYSQSRGPRRDPEDHKAEPPARDQGPPPPA